MPDIWTKMNRDESQMRLKRAMLQLEGIPKLPSKRISDVLIDEVSASLVRDERASKVGIRSNRNW